MEFISKRVKNISLNGFSSAPNQSNGKKSHLIQNCLISLDSQIIEKSLYLTNYSLGHSKYNNKYLT